MALDIDKEYEAFHQTIRKMRSEWVVYRDDRLLPQKNFEDTSLGKKMQALREELADIVPADKLDALQRHMKNQFDSWIKGFPIVKETWDAGFEEVLRILQEEKKEE